MLCVAHYSLLDILLWTRNLHGHWIINIAPHSLSDTCGIEKPLVANISFDQRVEVAVFPLHGVNTE